MRYIEDTFITFTDFKKYERRFERTTNDGMSTSFHWLNFLGIEKLLKRIQWQGSTGNLFKQSVLQILEYLLWVTPGRTGQKILSFKSYSFLSSNRTLVLKDQHDKYDMSSSSSKYQLDGTSFELISIKIDLGWFGKCIYKIYWRILREISCF